MAIYKLFPSQDASIYSFYPTMNTGIDPILEVGNINININPLPQVFRSLIKFDQDEINDLIENTISGSNYKTNLKLFIAEAQGIIFDTNIEVFPLSGSWENGNGTYLDSPYTTNGVSWKFQNYLDGESWPVDILNLDPYVNLYYSSSFLEGGGTWFTGSNDPFNINLHVTQSFKLRGDKDLNVDVTDIVNVWVSSSLGITPYTPILNQGFIIKFEDTIEFNKNPAIQPVLQFYSVDTNTIYPPILEFKWDDSYYSSSLPIIPDESVYVSLDYNQGKFYNDSINKFRLNVRPKYPPKTYQTSSVYTNNYKLPETSYYAIKDLDTNEYVIDFDENFTKISCDNEGNYFTLYMNGLQPERNYKILIKTIINNNILILDNHYTFKIING